MARPLFAPENLFSRTQYPDHVVSADEEPSGNEAFRVGTARRSARNYATASTANDPWWVKVACDQVRAASFLAIDRGHNLNGETVELHGSNDDFSTYATILSETVPASVSPFQDLRAGSGALTEEGAWLRSFNPHAYQYWRVYVPAMGAGLLPQIVGAYLGLAWEPAFLQALPFTFGGRELSYDETVSDTAWVGASRPAQRAETTINYQCESWGEYDVARLFVENMMWRRRPTWYVPDQGRAERSWLGVVPPGTYRFEQRPGWGYPQTSFPLVEHEPRLTQL